MPCVDTPQSFCRLGVAQCDITPPVGIYHRTWGAATHDQSTGTHRPLTATALVAEPLQGYRAGDAQRLVLVCLDLCMLWHAELQDLRTAVCQANGLASDELQVTFSHTHSTGLMGKERSNLPGGHLIPPYLDELTKRVSKIVGAALKSTCPGAIAYGVGRCDLGQNRDFWDAERGEFVCGLNPGGPTDDTVLVARCSDDEGKVLATLVNYACHPTTLAWDNTLISPDYIGAMRELVEGTTHAPCLFVHGASGDIGPREGFVGDVKVADRNGRQLGYAALSALESLPQAGTVFEYAGAVVSGATIGTWKHRPLDPLAREAKSYWRSRAWTVDLPYRTDLPKKADTEAELARWQAEEKAAAARGDTIGARDCHAQAERMFRLLGRIKTFPTGKTFAMPVALWQMGDAFWLLVEAEYYNVFQRELRRRLPHNPLLVATMTNGWRQTYLPTRESYGKGIYQESIAHLAAGTLETLTEAIAAQLHEWQRSETASAAAR